MDEKPSFFRNPRIQIILSVIGGLLLYAYLTSRLGGVEKNVGAIWLDSFLFYAALVGCLFFFSQFILPVSRLDERGKVFVRLVRYLTRQHGPAVFIEGGEIIAHGSELKQRGDGVAYLDAASGAILSNDVSFTRAVGPGVAFTQLKRSFLYELECEHVANAIDLHYRFVKIGPQPGEDPFADTKSLPEEDFHSLQERRWQTSGLTRDGNEIVPIITVFFKVGNPPELNNPRFRYDEQAVFKAGSGEGNNPRAGEDGNGKTVAWHQLPGLLAADIWRDTLTRFTLEDLFRELRDASYPGEGFWDKPTSEGGKRSTGLEFIIRHIEATLTLPRVRQLDAFGRVVYKMDPLGGISEVYAASQPFHRLHERGVKVIKVAVDNLHLRKEIEEQIERRWESSWLDRAIAERELLDQGISASREVNHQEALQDYSSAVIIHADPAIKQIRDMPPAVLANKTLPANQATIDKCKTEVLREMAEGTLDLFMDSGLLRKRAPLDKNQLNELIEWLQRKP